MIIQIDTREKPKAVEDIIGYFDIMGVSHISSKMYVGDYCRLDNPLLIIDRKQNIAELAQNATSGHDRFKRELQRLDEIGGKMIILIQQTQIGSDKIRSLEDIMLWKNRYGTIHGPQIYKILATWRAKHNIEYVFCSKRETGKTILRLLGDESE